MKTLFSAHSIRLVAVMAMCLMVCQLMPQLAVANPTGGTVAQGAATFSTSGSQFTVNQTSANAYINWQSFNIGAGETTTFVQPSSTSLVWNRINDVNPSQILGNLNANGYVILQNESGFYIGGQAAISTHGLILTTTPTAMPDLSSGGAWSFNTPPPTAKIINYGQINIAGGGSAFLIASDIENNGTISAPNGKIGLYAGEKVLVSSAPDARGLSAVVTLPTGSVDNEGKLIADAGSIAAQAQVVNQNGWVQANSVKNVNGTIELVANDAMNLGASSKISAAGDNENVSAGGAVTIKSDNAFSDQTGSAINIAGGTQGGDGGQVEISAKEMDAINSIVNGKAVDGFIGGSLTIDPVDLVLNSSYISSLNSQISGGLSQIDLQADNNITLSSFWTLADLDSAAQLSLTAGNNIIFNSSLAAGKNWSVNLTAGTAFSGTTTTSGSDGIYLNGSSYLQAKNGALKLLAASEVIVGSGAIRTIGGGNISVTATYGDVNSGTGTYGFNYLAKAPYYTPFNVNSFSGTISSSSLLSGISTAAGGDVIISAGRNVTSYLPSGTGTTAATSDAGTGAFGSEPGNVTINAGTKTDGNVYGHYVVVNGTGKITASQNIGIAGKSAALSLVTGSWNLKTINGDIYLQEVRNPNGVFNTLGNSATSKYYYDYDPLATVNLDAADGVYLTGSSLPRTSDESTAPVALPILLPPTLKITAGAGGVTLENNFTLFPSNEGGLEITTTQGGNFTSGGGAGTGYQLIMSDSGETRWSSTTKTSAGADPFSSADHASTPVMTGNTDPVKINIDGNMENVVMQTSKQTQLNVAGDMINCGFYGQNVNAGDVTTIDVKGQIYNPGSFNYVTLDQKIANLAQNYLPAGVLNNWQTALTLAVDPALNASLEIPYGTDPSEYSAYLSGVLLFGNSLQSSFAYDDKTKRLTFIGSMSANVLAALTQPLNIVRYGNDGNPLVEYTTDASGTKVGHFVTDSYNWVDASKVQELYAKSQGAPALGTASGGYIVGGTGDFNVTADSISLGNAYGILSLGSGSLLGKDYSNLSQLLKTEKGANITVTVAQDPSDTQPSLVMPSSTIASLGSGSVTVKSTAGSMDLGSQYLVQFEGKIMTRNNLGLGIYSSGGGNVTVTAQKNINIDSSRIGTFNGGDVFIESFAGNIDAGSGGNVSIPINVFSPFAPSLTEPFEYVYANGIVAQTLVNGSKVPGSAELPGNITVIADQGDITASQGGILQEALNGNISAGPTVTLKAGNADLGYVGNIDLGDSGVIGGTVNLSANGDIKGLVISRQNSTVNAAQSFSGTVLSGGTANLNAGGTVSGTIIGATGVNASGVGGISATLLGQNVSVNGGTAQSTLGTTATATSASQSAAGTASDQAQQVASNVSGSDDDDKKHKKNPKVRKMSRVTVFLSATVPQE